MKRRLLIDDHDIARRGVMLLLLLLLLPCMVNRADASTESSKIPASTIADVEIHMSYLISAAERNRLLTIVKACGTGHSNQVRGVVLSDAGIELIAPYAEEGTVFTGTLRWQKEQQVARDRTDERAGAALRVRELLQVQMQLGDQIVTLQRQAQDGATELRVLQQGKQVLDTDEVSHAAALRERPGAVRSDLAGGRGIALGTFCHRQAGSGQEPAMSAAAHRFRLKLYVAGDSAALRKARLNLTKLLLELQLYAELMVIDVFADFDLALQQPVFVTPALVVCYDTRRQTLVGDVSKTEPVVATLRALM